jgi:hypothetical protein
VLASTVEGEAPMVQAAKALLESAEKSEPVSSARPSA